jgi:hypothetical protein
MVTISIPSAKSMSIMAHKNAERIHNECMEQREMNESIGWSEIPHFINFIKNRIENATRQGLKEMSFSFVDCNFNSFDERIKYRFKGSFTYDMCQYVKNIFEQCGYEACIYKLNTNCGCPYRNGAVEISWRKV